MCRRLFMLLLFVALCAIGDANAQIKREKLALLLQNIYGPGGLVVDSKALLPDGSDHSAHFNSAFQSEFKRFNVALADQLAAVPLPSPASGFTYTFDSATGTFKRSTQSFGPILSDRAETIGKNRFSFGYNFQYFSFDAIDGVELFTVPAVFTHDKAELGGGRTDVVATENSLEANVGQFTAFITYGIADRLDVSLAIPVVQTRLNLISNATIVRVGTGSNTAVHFFARDDFSTGDQKQFFSGGTATGMGDLILRLKGTAIKYGRSGLALGVDLRLPTGDEKDLLGSGALGVRSFGALSFVLNRFSPHLDFGYQWNGSSVLAGDLLTSQKQDLPDQAFYVVGADIGVNEHLTFVFDFLGQHFIDSPRLVQRPFNAIGDFGSVSLRDIGFETDSFAVNDGSVGFKLNPSGNLLVNFNLRFKLNDNGLRDRITPLIGFEYSF